MITVIVHHWVSRDKFEEIKTLIRMSGKAMQSRAGFVLRQTLVSEVDPLQITTVTCWDTLESFERFAKERDREMPNLGESPWTKQPEMTIYTRIPELP